MSSMFLFLGRASGYRSLAQAHGYSDRIWDRREVITYAIMLDYGRGIHLMHLTARPSLHVLLYLKPGVITRSYVVSLTSADRSLYLTAIEIDAPPGTIHSPSPETCH